MFICMTILLKGMARADHYQLNVPAGLKGNNHIHLFLFFSFKYETMKQVLFTYWVNMT